MEKMETSFCFFSIPQQMWMNVQQIDVDSVQIIPLKKNRLSNIQQPQSHLEAEG